MLSLSTVYFLLFTRLVLETSPSFHMSISVSSTIYHTELHISCVCAICLIFHYMILRMKQPLFFREINKAAGKKIPGSSISASDVTQGHE